MSSLNKVMLIGNLGRDPEVRTMSNGDRVVSFSLATTETWKDKDGEQRGKTEWHNVVIFNDGLGRIVEQYLRKGSKVYVAGQLQTREYTDKDGAKRKTTEVVLRPYRGELMLLSGREERRSDDAGQRASKPEAAPIDDDIPF
jgi:single-strand DNA-binding protein